MMFDFHKYKRRTKCILIPVLLAAFCFCMSGPVLADDSASSAVNRPARIEAVRSGWYVDGNKAKYYDPKTHEPCKNGKYRIEGKLIRFDKKGYALNYASVGTGKMFRTIKAAVKFLIASDPQIAASPVNETRAYVDIFEGTYSEGINLQTLAGKGRAASGIYFKGIGNVTWRSPADYPTGCLCGYGAVTVENISFSATSKGSDPAYAYHYEAGEISFPSSNPGVFFKKCSFRSAGNYAVGIGMGRKYSRVTFKSCTFSGSKGDIYFHNSVYEGSDKNLLRFVRCSAKEVYIFDAAHWNADRFSKVRLRFTDNAFERLYLNCGNMGKYADKGYRYIPKNYPNFDIVSSGGNTNSAFDHKGK